MYCCILWAGCGRNVAATSRVIGGLNLCPIADRNSINIAYSPASKSARCVGVTTGCGSSSRLPMSALDIIADVLDRLPINYGMRQAHGFRPLRLVLESVLLNGRHGWPGPLAQVVLLWRADRSRVLGRVWAGQFFQAGRCWGLR